jgi:hypothetical protein
MALKTTNPLNIQYGEYHICVKPKDINKHIDSGCESDIDEGSTPLPQIRASTQSPNPSATQKPSVSTFFQAPPVERAAAYPTPNIEPSPSLSLTRSKRITSRVLHRVNCNARGLSKKSHSQSMKRTSLLKRKW